MNLNPKLAGIARICHQINRALRMGLGEDGGPDWFAASDHIKNAAIAGVQFHLDNPEAQDEDAHKAWMNHKLEHGWTCGPEKSELLKTDPCLTSFGRLPLVRQAEVRLFGEVVRMVAPAFQHMENMSKDLSAIHEQSMAEQQGALLYIAAMVKRFGGETGTVHLAEADMLAAVELELMRHDTNENGLVLMVRSDDAPAQQAVQAADPAVLDTSLPAGG